MLTDLNALKFNQITVVLLTALALLARMPWLAGALGAAMLVGARWPSASPLRALYRAASRVCGWTPQVVQEDPRAHHFAQGVGGSVLLLCGAAGLLGFTLLGAALGVLVMALALLNLTSSICVGCLMYHQWRLLRHRWTHAQ